MYAQLLVGEGRRTSCSRLSGMHCKAVGRSTTAFDRSLACPWFQGRTLSGQCTLAPSQLFLCLALFFSHRTMQHFLSH